MTCARVWTRLRAYPNDNATGGLFAPASAALSVRNTIFGDPVDSATWSFGVPSLWTWQLLWWALGVGMLWFLGSHMELAAPPHRDVEGPVDDIGDREVTRM